MQWAEGGRYVPSGYICFKAVLINFVDSLDDFIDGRLGRSSKLPHLHPPSSQSPQSSRSARIRAFRTFQHAPPEERKRMRGREGGDSWKAIHLLSAEEVKSLFSDVVHGLGFLVSLYSLSVYIDYA